MASNTKLFPEQKQYVRNYQNDNPTVVFFYNQEITVMVKPEFKRSRMLAVSISTMAPSENKFRKSVGKYNAISKFEDGQIVLMNKDTLFAFLDNTLCLNGANPEKADENLQKLSML